MKEKPKPLDLEIYEEVDGAREEIIDLFYSNKKVDEKDIRRVFWHLKKNVIEDIKSACEFYLRYKDNPELLLEEYPEYEEKVKEIEKEAYQKEFYMEFVKNYFLEKYNEWLFKLAFKDVLEEGE